MKNRFRLISRGSRGGAYYCVDGSTGKRTSLGTCSRDEAAPVPAWDLGMDDNCAGGCHLQCLLGHPLLHIPGPDV